VAAQPGRTRLQQTQGRRERRRQAGNDYAGNFADFLAARPEGPAVLLLVRLQRTPPRLHQGRGPQGRQKLADAPPPPFLPDTPEVRSDLLDYCVEIENFDLHLGRMLAQLEAAGELDNTLVIVTSDNGMAFPRAKANLYEYGFHEPLAIRWGARAPGGRIVDDPSASSISPPRSSRPRACAIRAARIRFPDAAS
jgi:N-sulfoglucosamine sulfohydrolase